jgi:acyl carrier protein
MPERSAPRWSGERPRRVGKLGNEDGGMSVSAAVESFLVNEVTVGRDIRSLGPDENLLARGIIDSLGVTQLATFIEERFGVPVEDEDLVPSNFENINRIVEFIARKQQG